MKTLADIKPGDRAVVKNVKPTGIKGRLTDLGLIPGTKVECLRISPLGDPAAFLIRGAVIALRSEDSSRVLVEN